MNPRPIPSAKKALVAMRFALEIMPDASPLALQCALFDADAEHVDAYGRQIYGELWRIDWSGPRGRIIDAVLTRDPIALSLLDIRDRFTISEIGHTRGSDTMRLHAALEKIRALAASHGSSPKPSDILSQSDMDAISTACGDVPDGDDRILERLIRHPVTMRSDGMTVEPRDMLDPGRSDHDRRLRALAETSASTFY